MAPVKELNSKQIRTILELTDLGPQTIRQTGALYVCDIQGPVKVSALEAVQNATGRECAVNVGEDGRLVLIVTLDLL